MALPAGRLAKELARDSWGERVRHAIVDDDEFARPRRADHHEPIEPHGVGALGDREDIGAVRGPALLERRGDTLPDASHQAALVIRGFQRLAAVLNASASLVVQLSDDRARGRRGWRSPGPTIDGDYSERNDEQG